MVRNGNPFQEKTALQKLNEDRGLIYDGATVADLVENDADGDGVADWEEALWDLDPTQKETTPGTPDFSTYSKLKAGYVAANYDPSSEENLTETDKFSRELLSTVSALTQNGAMDENTIENISASLAERMQHSTQKKVFSSSDTIIATDDSKVAITKYANAIQNIHNKYPLQKSILEILQKFLVDENTVDPSVLTELDHIITQTESIIREVIKTPVPPSLSLLHIDFANKMQGLVENLENIQLYETDSIMALGAVTRYEETAESLREAAKKLNTTINQKLGN